MSPGRRTGDPPGRPRRRAACGGPATNAYGVSDESNDTRGCPLSLDQLPPWLEALFTSDLAFAVLFGVAVLEGAMLLRFMPSELLVPSALFFIGTSTLEVAAIVVVAVVGTTVGQAILFTVVRLGGRTYVLAKW